MIYLDTNSIQSTEYLLRIRRKNANAYKAIDSYVDAAAVKGAPETQGAQSTDETQNTKSSTSAKNIDYSGIIKSLELGNVDNRLAVLKMLSHSDLVQLLSLMDKEELTMGLSFFTKQKLLRYIMNLPKAQLLKMLSQIYSKEQLIAMMPMKELCKFLDSSKIEQRDLLKLIQSLPPHILMQMMEAITGQPANNMSNKELIKSLSGMDQSALMDGIKALPYKDMLGIINNLTKNNADLMMEFSQQALFAPLMRLQKSEITSSMIVLDPDQLVKLLGQLPDQLLSQVVSLLDPEKLSGMLEKFHKNLLAYIAA